jgi:hypothetical protein
MPTSTTIVMGSSVPLTSADDVQAALDLYPTGTTFLLFPGTYRPPAQDGYVPKARQRIVGNGLGVIINGSKVVTGWTLSGGKWSATGFLPGSSNGHGFCLADGENGLCTHRQDVFLDGARLTRVGSQAAVGAGQFFTDYATNTIWIGSDPAGKTVEQAWNNRLFSSNASGITVQNLVLEKAANDAQSAVVEPLDDASDWTVAYNEVRYNHGGGLSSAQDVGFRNYIHHNYVHHNGQIGISGQGVDGIVETNRIASNNALNFDPGWEGGGTKFVFTIRLLVRGNYVHDNNGPGLWTDIDNIHTIYEENDCRNNKRGGIFHEISYAAIIRNNVLVENAEDDNAAIMIAASRDVEVYGNENYGDIQPIYVWQQPRGTGLYGERVIRNLYVHDNDVDLNSPIGGAGQTGLIISSGDPQFANLFDPSANNRFENNTYHRAGGDAAKWAWGLDTMNTFATWQSLGHDDTGSLVSDTPSAPSPPSLTVGPQA